MNYFLKKGHDSVFFKAKTNHGIWESHYGISPENSIERNLSYRPSKEEPRQIFDRQRAVTELDAIIASQQNFSKVIKESLYQK